MDVGISKMNKLKNLFLRGFLQNGPRCLEKV